MRNKAVFLGIFIAVSAIATVVGFAVISASDDKAPGETTQATTATPRATIVTQSIPDGTADSGDQGYSIYPTPAPEATGAPANVGGTGGVGGTAGSGGVGGGAGGGASTGGGAGTTSSSAQIIDRKIERNSTLSITADSVITAVNQITAAATSVGGYVSQQNITEMAGPDDEEGNPTSRQQATVQIRVPSEAYDNVMSGLRGIAREVTSENSQTVEVTAQYTDLESQLRNLEATETQYLALLDRAFTIEEILTVSDRLAPVRYQIEQVQGQINLLDNLTSLATITINVSLPPVVVERVIVEEPQPEPVKEPNFARQALDDSWEASEDVLEYIAIAGITAGVVMVWVLVPASALWIGWWLFGRRRGAGPAAS